nr:hypothetical protein BaRGS_023557 [Batillaria attramentaria]
MTSLGAFEYEQKESKGNYDIKKKRRAPPPPTGLGQYKPKILSDDSLGNVPANRNSEESTSTAPTRPPRRSSGSQHQNGNAGNSGQVRALVMGDKDTPMVLHPSGDDAMEVDADDDESLLLRSDVVAVHEGGTETDNPLFNMRQDSIEEAEQTQEPEGVFIPAPDYDEEEKTIELTDEPEEDFDPSPRRGKKVYKEYAGEDFSQYLSDDETDPRVELRRPPRRPMHIMERKSKTEAKRPHYKKLISVSQAWFGGVRTTVSALHDKLDQLESRLAVSRAVTTAIPLLSPGLNSTTFQSQTSKPYRSTAVPEFDEFDSKSMNSSDLDNLDLSEDLDLSEELDNAGVLDSDDDDAPLVEDYTEKIVWTGKKKKTGDHPLGTRTLDSVVKLNKTTSAIQPSSKTVDAFFDNGSSVDPESDSVDLSGFDLDSLEGDSGEVKLDDL